MKNKGITLVALIITIIILLILAGITIGQLTGNGIFENAKNAKEKYENAQDYEQMEIAGLTNKIDEQILGGRLLDTTTSIPINYDTTDSELFDVEEGSYLYKVGDIFLGYIKVSIKNSVTITETDWKTIGTIDSKYAPTIARTFATSFNENNCSAQMQITENGEIRVRFFGRNGVYGDWISADFTYIQ